MNARAIRCVKKMYIPFQRWSFNPQTILWATSSQPPLSRLHILHQSSFGTPRLFSSTSKSLRETQGTNDGWMGQGVPDVSKWNERMDKLAERSNTDEKAILEWADLLEAGVTAKLPDIEFTLMRHRKISPNLESYMDAVLDEDDDIGAEYDEYEEYEDEEDEDEYDDEDDMDCEVYEHGKTGVVGKGDSRDLIKPELAKQDNSEMEGLREEVESSEHKLEAVAREELANELEREQGSGDKRHHKF